MLTEYRLGVDGTFLFIDLATSAGPLFECASLTCRIPHAIPGAMQTPIKNNVLNLAKFFIQFPVKQLNRFLSAALI